MKLTVGIDNDAKDFVRRELTAFNREQSPALRSLYEQELGVPKSLHVFARDESGAVVGGVFGEMRFAWFAIDVVWVSEAYRGQGLGARLLQIAEDAAKSTGVIGLYLDTLDFQARGFYEKQGYLLYGELKNAYGPHTKFLLAKRLDAALPT